MTETREYRSGLELDEYPEAFFHLEEYRPEEAGLGPITMLALAMLFFIPTTAITVYLMA
jgi:hypothetical protein